MQQQNGNEPAPAGIQRESYLPDGRPIQDMLFLLSFFSFLIFDPRGLPSLVTLGLGLSFATFTSFELPSSVLDRAVFSRFRPGMIDPASAGMDDEEPCRRVVIEIRRASR